jgi:hypothetical protein
LGGTARLYRLPGILLSWPGGCSGPSFGHWPPSGVDGLSDECRGAVPRVQRHSTVGEPEQQVTGQAGFPPAYHASRRQACGLVGRCSVG